MAPLLNFLGRKNLPGPTSEGGDERALRASMDSRPSLNLRHSRDNDSNEFKLSGMPESIIATSHFRPLTTIYRCSRQGQWRLPSGNYCPTCAKTNQYAKQSLLRIAVAEYGEERVFLKRIVLPSS